MEPLSYYLPTAWLAQLMGDEQPSGDTKTWLDARPFLGSVVRTGGEVFATIHDALDFHPRQTWCREFTFARKDTA